MPGRRGAALLLAGTLLAAPALAEDPEGVSPFPIAPLPGGGGGAPPAGAGGDPGGVGPFPLPGVGPAPGGERAAPPARPDAPAGRGPSEREVGVPPFPYDPEARGGLARTCVRDCIDRRSACARAGEPARRCEGEFVLCARDCVLAPGPADFRPPGN